MSPLPPLYIFLVIPKTGSTTIQRHLMRYYGPQGCLLLRDRAYRQLSDHADVDALVQSLSTKQRFDLRAIFGHASYYGMHRHFPEREVRYITFMRDPLARCVSWYNFLYTRYLKFGDVFPANPYACPIVENRRLIPFSEWYARSPIAVNFNLKFLYASFACRFNLDAITSQSDWEMLLEKLQHIDARALTEAGQIFSQCYFVGCTESAEDFELLYRFLGIPGRLSRANISRKIFRLSSLTASQRNEFREMFEKENALDSQLYNLAIERNRECKNIIDSSGGPAISKGDVDQSAMGWLWVKAQSFREAKSWIKNFPFSAVRRFRLKHSDQNFGATPPKKNTVTDLAA